MLRTDYARARSASRTSRTSSHAARACAAPVEPLERRTMLSFAPAGGPFRVNDPNDTFDFQADVATDADGDSVVTWFHVNEDFTDGWPVARLFDAEGNPKGPEFRVNAHSCVEPAWIDMDDAGNFVVGFVADDVNLYVRLFDAAGNPRGAEFQVDTDVPGSPGGGAWPWVDLAMNGDGSFAVAWKHNDEAGQNLLYARRYDAAGNPLSPSFRVDEPEAPAGAALDPQMDVDGKGEMFVAWRRREGNGISGEGDLYGRVFSDTNVPEGGTFLIDGGGDHSLPSVAASKTGFVVSWRDSSGVHGGPQSVRAQRFNRHGAAQGAPILVESDLPTAGVFYGGPRADATPDGRFAVAWSRPSSQQFQPGTAYLRQYDAAGVPLSGPVQLGSGVGSDGLYGFAADNSFAHGLLVWGNDSDSSVTGQRVADPSAAASPAVTSNGEFAATELLYA